MYLIIKKKNKTNKKCHKEKYCALFSIASNHWRVCWHVRVGSHALNGEDCCRILFCIISFFSSTLSLGMIQVIPLSFSRLFCRLLNFFSLSRTISLLNENRFLNDLMDFSQVCFAWFNLSITFCNCCELFGSFMCFTFNSL